MKTSLPGRNPGDINFNLLFVVGAVVLGGMLIALSFNFEKLASPSTWLTDWTNWAAKYVALVVAAHSVIRLVDATASRIKGSGC